MANENSLIQEEELWRGEFGDEYLDRNPETNYLRRPFWEGLVQDYEITSAMEVGSGSGVNLEIVGEYCEGWGVEINTDALLRSREVAPWANTVQGSIYDLPFKDNFFEIVFTCGVLIHQPPANVVEAMEEVVRCSSGLVLSVEYESEEFEEIPYRGQEGALWKGPYSRFYEDMNLEFVDGGFLTKEQGFDNCTWSLFRK